MKKIWKYELKNVDYQVLKIRNLGFILDLKFDGVPTIWVLIDDKGKFRDRHFYFFNTGEDIPDEIDMSLQYIGTININGIIKHLFEEHKRVEHEHFEI